MLNDFYSLARHMKSGLLSNDLQRLVGAAQTFNQFLVSCSCELNLELQSISRQSGQSMNVALSRGGRLHSPQSERRPLSLEMQQKFHAQQRQLSMLQQESPIPSHSEQIRSGIAIIGAHAATGFAAALALHNVGLKGRSIEAIIPPESSTHVLSTIEEVNIRICSNFARAKALRTIFRTQTCESLLLIPAALGPSRTQLCSRLLKVAARNGVKHVVMLSVLSAQYNSSDFGRAYSQIEHMLSKSDVKWTILRCAPFMDSFLSIRESIMTNGEIYGCSGNGQFAAIAIEGNYIYIYSQQQPINK